MGEDVEINMRDIPELIGATIASGVLLWVAYVIFKALAGIPTP